MSSVHQRLIAVAACTAFLLAACGTAPETASGHAKTFTAHNQRAKPGMNPEAVPNGPPHPQASGSIAVTLPVTKLSTSFGVDYGLTVPNSVTVTIPAAWVGDVAAYWSGTVFLAPAGWTGRGLYGADGSGGITLYPAGGSPSRGERITIFSDGGCVGCGVEPAAQFFPYLRTHWSQVRVIDAPAPRPVRVISEVFLSPNIAAYRLPDTRDGLEVNGVAYSGLIDHASDITFEQMNAYLPASDHGLATVILNYFLAHAMTMP